MCPGIQPPSALLEFDVTTAVCSPCCTHVREDTCDMWPEDDTMKTTTPAAKAMAKAMAVVAEVEVPIVQTT